MTSEQTTSSKEAERSMRFRRPGVSARVIHRAGWSRGLIAFVVCAVVVAWLLRTMADLLNDQPIRTLDTYAAIATVGAYAAAFITGVWRSLRPFPRWTYRVWLKTTPYRPGRPLPLGSAYLTWLDPIMLMVLAAIWPEKWQYIASWTIVGFALARTVKFENSTCSGRLLVGVCAAAPVLLFPLMWPWRLALAAGLLVVTCWESKRMLRHYQADLGKDRKRTEIEAVRQIRRDADSESQSMMVVMPFELDDDQATKRRTALLVAGMAAWWVWLCTIYLRDPIADVTTWSLTPAALLVVAVELSALGRLSMFLTAVQMRPSLLTRLRLGLWFLPSYDRVWLLLLIPGGIACLLIPVRLLPAPWGPAAAAGVVGLTALAAMCFPPRLEAWKLTAPGSLVSVRRVGNAEPAGAAAASQRTDDAVDGPTARDRRAIYRKQAIQVVTRQPM